MSSNKMKRNRKARRAMSSDEAAAEAASSSCDDIRPKRLQEVLCWLDMEMTGLNEVSGGDSIMEIAMLCTTWDLVPLDDGVDLVLAVPEEKLSGMDEWCTKHHGESGLTQLCKDSTLTIENAQNLLFEYVQKHVPAASTAKIAGNSVYMDMIFMRRDMPQLAKHFHYRLIDVSSFKEVAFHWQPRVHAKCPKKKMLHRAISDIHDSIAELKYYRENMLK